MTLFIAHATPAIVHELSDHEDYELQCYREPPTRTPHLLDEACALSGLYKKAFKEKDYQDEYLALFAGQRTEPWS